MIAVQFVRPDFQRFNATAKFAALDGLRAISVLAVLWHHTSGKPGPLISHRGDLGVDFFFAISGFLITILLVRERDRTGNISLRKFFARRALRILPLYYGVLGVYIVLVMATERDTSKGQLFFHNLPAFLTHTANWFIDLSQGESVTFFFAWSLSTEEQFYLLWPPLLVGSLILSKGKVWAPLTVLGVLAAVSVSVGFFTDVDHLPWRIPASLSLAILLGAAAAIAVNTERGFAAVSAVLGRVWSAPVVFMLLFVALWFPTPKAPIQVLMVLAVVAVTLTEKTLMHPMLAWRPLVFVGVISYGIYLMQMLCANIARKFVHEHFGILLFMATGVLVIAVAYASFRWFESPLLRLKRRFESVQQQQGDELSRGHA